MYSSNQEIILVVALQRELRRYLHYVLEKQLVSLERLYTSTISQSLTIQLKAIFRELFVWIFVCPSSLSMGNKFKFDLLLTDFKLPPQCR